MTPILCPFVRAGNAKTQEEMSGSDLFSRLLCDFRYRDTEAIVSGCLELAGVTVADLDRVDAICFLPECRV